MYEHLMTHRRPNLRGRFYCWWCLKRSGSLFVGTSNDQRSPKTKQLGKKLCPPKVGGKKGEMENLKTHGSW
jgi:hypothetical protein